MGALSLALPFSAFLYLLPSVTNVNDLGKVATTAIAEQLNNLIGVIDVPKELHGDNGEIKFKILGSSLNPLEVTKPVDLTKLNVDFQAKVESKNLPLSPNRGSISTNVQLANQAKWLQGVVSSESKASKEFSSEEEWAKSPTKAAEDATTEENRKNATVFHLYIPDIKDTLREKFAKASMQLGLDVGVTSKKDTDRNADKTDAVDNRARKKKNYIRLCKRLTDGSPTSLMQKLRGKDCVKLPRNEFYLDQGTRTVTQKKDDTIKLVGLKIVGAKTDNGKDYKDESGSNENNKQRSGMADIEASISDISANYDEPGIKVTDRFGTGLNIKTPMIDGRIGKFLRDGKLSLSASTALKV